MKIEADYLVPGSGIAAVVDAADSVASRTIFASCRTA